MPDNNEIDLAAAAAAGLVNLNPGVTEQGVQQQQEPSQDDLLRSLGAAQQIIDDQQEQMSTQATALKQLTDEVARLRINQQNPSPLRPRSVPTGTPPPILGKEHLSLIPDFCGEPDTLPNFLDITGKLFHRFWNSTDPNDFQNVMLLAGVKAKIKPPASSTLLSTTLTSFASIKTALLDAYSDKRDIFSLNIDLTKLKQYDSESPFTYHTRVKTALDNIISYLQVNDYHHAPLLTRHYESLALRVFLLHVKDPLGSMLRTRQPLDLNSALGMMTNELNLRRDPNLKSPQNQKQGNPTNRQPTRNGQPAQRPNQPWVPTPRPWVSPTQPQSQNYQPRPPFQPRTPHPPPASQPNPFNNPRSRQLPQQPRPAQPGQPRPPQQPQRPWQPMSWQTTNPNLHNIDIYPSSEPPPCPTDTSAWDEGYYTPHDQYEWSNSDAPADQPLDSQAEVENAMAPPSTDFLDDPSLSSEPTT